LDLTWLLYGAKVIAVLAKELLNKKTKNYWLVELKVKLYLSTPWMRGGAEVYLCLFIIPALDGGEW